MCINLQLKLAPRILTEFSLFETSLFTWALFSHCYELLSDETETHICTHEICVHSFTCWFLVVMTVPGSFTDPKMMSSNIFFLSRPAKAKKTADVLVFCFEEFQVISQFSQIYESIYLNAGLLKGILPEVSLNGLEICVHKIFPIYKSYSNLTDPCKLRTGWDPLFQQ